MILGVDLSSANPASSITDMCEAGHPVQFAILKSSEGMRYRDAQFPGFAADCRTYNIPWGPYHIWRFDGRSPEDQAEAAIRASRSSVAWNLPLMVDVETERNAPPDVRVKHLLAGLRALRSALRRRPMLYTYPGYWDGLGSAGRDPEFADYELCLAKYPIPCPSGPEILAKAPKTVPAPWTKATIWQFGGDANGSRVPGARGYIDQDVWLGDDRAFKAWIRGPQPEDFSEPEARHA